MADRWDDIFKALADANRRRIVAALCRAPRPAGDLARLAGLAPNAVSFHLRILRSAGLLAVNRHGRSLEYRLEPRTLSAWLGQIRRLFPDELIAPLLESPEGQDMQGEDEESGAATRSQARSRPRLPRGQEGSGTTGYRHEELPGRTEEAGPLPTELL